MATPQPRPPGNPGRALGGVLLSAVGVLLAIVILTPVALSSHDLIDWAAARTGLNLSAPWPVLVFLALDAAAGVCVLLAVYSAWRGEPGGAFGVLVWCFAAGSAFANWRNSRTPDAVWFYPAMSLAGPTLLEAVLRRLRRWVQRDTGRRSKPTPAFGWRRWTPGLGAARDTYGAYRTALLTGIDTVETAITAYHTLCPTGSLRVAAALRARHATPLPATPRRPQDRRPPPSRAPHTALLRRLPRRPDAYTRWQEIWTDLQHNGTPTTEIARRHGLSTRQIQFIRGAGQAGLLDSPHPPPSPPRTAPSLDVQPSGPT